MVTVLLAIELFTFFILVAFLIVSGILTVLIVLALLTAILMAASPVLLMIFLVNKLLNAIK
jgi:hypothetical protein